MKTSLVIVLVVLIVVSTLAIMNNACKSGQHELVRSDFQFTASHKNWLSSGT